MGMFDVEIDIERGSRWRNQNERQGLSSGPNRIPRNQTLDKYIDLQLYEAATKNDVGGLREAIEETLVEKKISLEAVFDRVSPLGNSLLHVAASSGNEETVRLIAQHSPPLLTEKNYKGDTALHTAAQAGDGSVVAALIRLGKELVPNDQLLRIENDEGNTPLHEALINNLESVALLLICEDPTIAFNLNGEGKSSLYLAAEAGYADCVKHMLENTSRHENLQEMVTGKSPIHAAIIGRNMDVLATILKNEPRFINSKDEEERTPLHYAASTGYLEGVCYLLGKYSPEVLERDATGFFPIHWASIKGHVDVIQELLQHCPDPRELLDFSGRNILHLAAKYGNYYVVSYIMRTRKLAKLINERDKDGHTPLHLATLNWHPKIVSAMTWDERVNLKLMNKKGLTALDAAERYMETVASIRQKLTWAALASAGAPRAPSVQFFDPSHQNSAVPQPSSINIFKDRINTLIVVSALVATVTFAAGFTMPGGYSNSDHEQGIATMLRHKKFHMFIFCDTIAMYSSIIVVISLIWAQLGDLDLMLAALRLAIPLLGISLNMMSLAFAAGVYLVLKDLHWLANSVLIMGSIFLLCLCLLFFPLCLPFSSSYRTLRYVSYYPFSVLIFVTRSYGSINSDKS